MSLPQTERGIAETAEWPSFSISVYARPGVRFFFRSTRSRPVLISRRRRLLLLYPDASLLRLSVISCLPRVHVYEKSRYRAGAVRYRSARPDATPAFR